MYVKFPHLRWACFQANLKLVGFQCNLGAQPLSGFDATSYHNSSVVIQRNSLFVDDNIYIYICVCVCVCVCVRTRVCVWICVLD